VPASLVGTIQDLVHQVFVNGYVIAMRPTVAVAVMVLVVASVSCVLVLNRRQVPDEARAPVDVADAA